MLPVRTKRAYTPEIPALRAKRAQQNHAKSLGVHRDTIARWEKDRKEIAEDPELAAKATTLEGYKEAKKAVRTDVKQSREKACYTPSHLSSNRTTSWRAPIG